MQRYINLLLIRSLAAQVGCRQHCWWELLINIWIDDYGQLAYKLHTYANIHYSLEIVVHCED